MKNEMRRVYLHEGQKRFLNKPQRVKCGICGRGWGKTSLFAAVIKQIVKEMPGSFGAYVSLSFGQVKNLSLGAIQKALKKEGFIKDLHYVVGKRPPKNLKYERPEVEPEDYRNIISFFNGVTINLISSKTSDTNRGGSYDFLIFDEACFFEEDFYKNIIKPSLRGYARKFIQKETGEPSRWYKSQTIMSSRPRTGQGKWVYNFKELQRQKPDKYFFYEASARENIVALGGEEWFEEQLDDLGPLVYAIEIENIDLNKVPDGYYSKFDETMHTYTPQLDRNNNMCDIDNNRMLSVSFDFGGWFTCATVWQEKNNTEYLRREYYVKETGTINDLVNKIIRDFDKHEFKRIEVYGDPNGYNKNPFAEDNAYNLITQLFEKHGWEVEVLAEKSYQDLSHTDRRENINMILSNENPLLPKVLINKIACPNVIIAIGLTDTNPDGSKNKKLEKDRKSPQEHAPHFTDTFDYYLHRKYRATDTRTTPGRVWK